MIDIKLNIPTKKNLLAFSAGVDSSALFNLLVEQNIPFDIAIVDYNQRKQSKEEVIYATQLAHKYNKKYFVSVYDSSLIFNEKNARDFRYSFFDEVMKQESYESLITAHQLNDKCEWFLMQFTKGAGLSELLGMEKETLKDGYKVLKPLLDISREELQNYLDTKGLKYFVDESNFDEKYKRNYFRKNFVNELIKNYSNGISKSFEYLHNDLNSMFKDIDSFVFEELSIFSLKEFDENIAIRLVDKEIKKRGTIISKATRDEILEQKNCVVSHKIGVSIYKNKIFIAPYVQVPMDKKFKEKCRVLKIPSNIRGYLYSISYDLDILATCLQD